MALPTVTTQVAEQENGPAGSLYLLVLGHGRPSTHRLPESGALLIGRDETADIRLFDVRASRHHARLCLGPQLQIEDLGGVNGTMVGERRLTARVPTPICPGEALTIGSTLLVVQRRKPNFAVTRIQRHSDFESNLVEECARAEAFAGTFGLVRIHVEQSTSSGDLPSVLLESARPGDVVGLYGPHDYEILFAATGRSQVAILTQQLCARLAQCGCKLRSGIAMFPDDATSPQSLIAVACTRVGHRQESAPVPVDVVLENTTMRELFAQAARIAKANITVLITGDTGVGKEILAQHIHRASPRAAGPFVGLNCAAFSESLLESELFGYEKAAFTGATMPKAGLLEVASGGTLFLDEIGEMSLGAQAKILRAIETRSILRLGATKPRSIDVRFVAATNLDLEEEVQGKRFRQDLLFRLDGVRLEIPSLRDRVDEIEPLARRFMHNAAAELGRAVPELAPAAIQALRAHTWPGNVRELRNVMGRAVLLCEGPLICPEHLPSARHQAHSPRDEPQRAATLAELKPTEACTPPSSLRELERQAMLDALTRCAGNQTRAAELLGIGRRTLCTKLKEYGIARPRADANRDSGVKPPASSDSDR